jgi:ribose-phosphate pyrophosphokinase
MQKLITPYASDFGKVNITIKQFPDTESYVFIEKIDSLKGKNVTIYHRLYPEPEKRTFELLLILARLKKEVKNIELFIPYFPYARQDRESKKGEAVSADILCGLLKNYGVKKLITFDCHFLPKTGNFVRNGLKIENHSAGRQLLSYAKKYFGKQEFCVISPDEGSSYFIENAKGHTGHSLQKTRGLAKDNGIKNGIHAKVAKIEGKADVKGKNVCILDDIIATGGTIVHAIKHLKSLGAKKVIVGATHGVFAGEKISEKILKSGASRVFVTNSILNQKAFSLKLEI